MHMPWAKAMNALATSDSLRTALGEESRTLIAEWDVDRTVAGVLAAFKSTP